MRVKLPFSFFIGALWLLVSLAGLFSAAQTVSAGATGWGGVTGEADLPLAVPAGLAIAGPGAGSVDVPYEFTATLGAGSTPVDYTWEATDHSPITHTGGGLSDTVSFTWRTAGTKTITVTADDGAGTVMATYEVVIDHIPLDIMTVFDVSGSMDYETGCFGCWEPNNVDVIQHPWPNNGTHWPLPEEVTASAALCTQPVAAATNGSIQYLVHEAEFYSQISPPEGWRLDQRQVGQGFWVLQRATRTWGNNQLTGASIAIPNTADPDRGAYMRAHPLTVYSQENVSGDPQLQGAAYDEACFDGPNLSGNCWADRVAELQAAGVNASPPSHTPPRLDYDFTPKWSGTTHIWIRAQGGGSYADTWEGPAPNQLPASVKRQMPDYREAIFWQVTGADGSNPTDLDGGTYNNLSSTSDNRAPEADRWRWVKLGSVSTTQNVQYTLRLYQGSAGFSLDKIIFTNYSGGSNGSYIDNNGSGTSGLSTDFRNLVRQNGGKGPDTTDGSATREVCNVCNPAYGQTVDPSQCSCKKSSTDTAVSGPYAAGGSGAFCTRVLTTTNQLNNDLFHDIEPLRSAKEAVKDLAARLDPKFDQIGFVAFTLNVLNYDEDREKLQCKQWATQNDPANGELKCYDPATDPISFTTVTRAVERQRNETSTNIGQGMLEGLEELGLQVDGSGYVNSDCTGFDNNGRVCDRRGVAHRVLILLTDGAPNYVGGCHANARANLWQGMVGVGNDPYDCAIYYARAAAQNNVSVYTIGMGPGINSDLLAAMANGTDPSTGHVYFEPVCGQFFHASKLTDLDEIMTEILTLARSCPPHLSIAKSGPASATAGDLITYTLTISNSGPVPAHDLVISDIIPAGAVYVGGGEKIGDEVRWTIPNLVAGGITQTTFTVTATGSLINDDYGLQAAGGYETAGETVVTTLVNGPRYVAPGGVDSGNSCTNSLNPCVTVQHAVDVAEPGEVIKVATGSYSGINTYGGLTQMVYVSKTVTIRGGYTASFSEPPDPAANPTTLDAQGQGRIFYITGSISPTIEGLRLIRGNMGGLVNELPFPTGGGVYVISATLSFNNNHLISSIASSGGGLSLVNGKGVLNNNKISANRGDGGGGVILDHSEVMMNGNSITDNYAGTWGGGVYAYHSTLTFAHNVVSANSAQFGGGLLAISSDVTMQGNIISANSADFGGGVFWDASNVTLSNDTITSNSADEGGGAFLGYQSNVILTNTIVTDNQVTLSGSGLFIHNSSARFAHTTIAQNDGGNGTGIQVAGTSSVTLTNTILVSQTVGITTAAESMATLESTLWSGNDLDWGGVGNLTTSNNYSGDPAFIDPVNGDYHIGPASAAIDKGVAAGVATDIDGDLRDTPPDLGADEQLGKAPPAPVLSISKAGPAVVEAGQLITYTLTISNSGPASAHNLVITDALPGNASYVSGGSLVGQVVSWTIPSLAANGGMTQTQFVVTARQTITNSDYAVVATGGYGAAGSKATVTLVQPVEEEDQQKRFLPIILKQ
jgi:uncharacterized repeat protein (TIGR01451 family)